MVCFLSESLLRKPCDLQLASHEAGSSESGLPDLHTDLGAGPMFSAVCNSSESFMQVFMQADWVTTVH